MAQAGEGTLPRIHSRFLFLDLHPPLPASPLLHFYLLTVPAEYSPEQMSWAVVRAGINKVCVPKNTYHVDEHHGGWPHPGGDRDGDEPAQGDEAPEEAGEVTSRLVSDRQWLLHSIAIHKGRIRTLCEEWRE